MDRQGAFPVQRRPPESKWEQANRCCDIVVHTPAGGARAYIRLLNALAHDVTRHCRARSHIRLLEALAHDVKGLRPKLHRRGKILKGIILWGDLA